MPSSNTPTPWDCPDTYGKESRPNASDYSPLRQWPIKLRSISPVAPYFHQADLLLAADCTAFAYGNFHPQMTGDKVTVIGCPSSDGIAFSVKLMEIIKYNDIKSITLVRMDAPCCGSIAKIVMSAIKKSRKDIPLRITTVFVEGEIVD